VKPIFAETRAAELKFDGVANSTSVLSLFPEINNVHMLEAHSNTAILDVFIPPYDEAAGRPCHYFQVQKQDSDQVVLEHIPEPKSFKVYQAWLNIEPSNIV